MTVQEYNNIYKNAVVAKMRIVTSGNVTITNENICSEQMSLEESLCSDENLMYGACESSCFKIRVAAVNHNFKDEWLDVYQRVMTDSEGYLLDENGDYILTEDGKLIQLGNGTDTGEIHIGRYKVHSDKPTNDRLWRDLTCYDIMHDILNTDVLEWYNGLTFPMTIEDFRNSLFTYLQVTQTTKTLINDTLRIEGGFKAEGSLSCKEIITALCEINAVFGHITPDGKFDYVSLNENSVELSWYVDGSGSYEDYTVNSITGVVVREDETDIGTLVGTDTNPYVIDDNILLYGLEGTNRLQSAMTRWLNAVTSISSYRPYEITTYGNPMLPLGTAIQISTRNQTINSYVINKTLAGIQAMKDRLSAKGDEIRPNYINSARSTIERIKGSVATLKADVNEFVLKLDSNGNIVSVELKNDASTGSQFKVQAKNISFIANDTIEMTANNIAINSTYFSVTKSGALTATSGKIGGWTFNDTMLFKEITVTENSASVTYRPMINAPTTPTASNVAFGVVRTEGGTNTYPFRINYDGSMTCTNATIKGDINTTSLKIDNKANLSIATRSVTESDFTISPSSVSMSADAVITEVLQISPGYGLYVPSVVEFGNYALFKNVSTAKLDCSGDVYMAQNLYIHGWTHFDDGIELYHRISQQGITPTPFLDFHYDNDATVDYTARIVADDYARITFEGRDSSNTNIGCELRARAFTVYSSKKVKKNIKNITEEEAKKILQLRPVSFDYKTFKANNQRGLIAEEVMDIMPEMVIGGDIPAIDYSRFVPYLIKMVQIQQKQIDKLMIK